MRESGDRTEGTTEVIKSREDKIAKNEHKAKKKKRRYVQGTENGGKEEGTNRRRRSDEEIGECKEWRAS